MEKEIKKQQLTVKPVAHRNVGGKTLWYLEISDGYTLFHINVGQKTYNTVHEMESQLKMTTLLDQTETAETKSYNKKTNQPI